MREMDDNDFSKSDNFDTQQLHLNVNLRVISTVSTRDRTVTQLLHNKPNTDELTCHFAPASMDLIDFTPLILQGLYNALLTKHEDAIRASSKQWQPSRASLCTTPTPTRPTHLPVLPLYLLVNAISDMVPTKDEKGTYICILPGSL